MPAGGPCDRGGGARRPPARGSRAVRWTVGIVPCDRSLVVRLRRSCSSPRAIRRCCRGVVSKRIRGSVEERQRSRRRRGRGHDNGSLRRTTRPVIVRTLGSPERPGGGPGRSALIGDLYGALADRDGRIRPRIPEFAVVWHGRAIGNKSLQINGLQPDDAHVGPGSPARSPSWRPRSARKHSRCVRVTQPLRHAYIGPCHAYTGLRHAYTGPCHAYTGLRHAYTGLRHAYTGPCRAYTGSCHASMGPCHARTGPCHVPGRWRHAPGSSCRVGSAGGCLDGLRRHLGSGHPGRRGRRRDVGSGRRGRRLRSARPSSGRW